MIDLVVSKDGKREFPTDERMDDRHQRMAIVTVWSDEQKKNWMITNFRYKKTIQVQCIIPVSSNVWKNLEKKYEETLNILITFNFY